MPAAHDHGHRRARWLGMALLCASACTQIALLVWVAGQATRAFATFTAALP